ncbi:hypothetical protein DFO67_11533 [Modicisalibacter xianhensis]|uniref:Uncharacterized protein n=1 Tax=Modicisalibacter xianhensis TaxID=442341 RepID=A0A4R8FRN6_9GAMM|nr:hypothetical protein [Halomonas xianhensis]TDX26768.1 hypothetical protein DFO67_11533 [Halomonas xianhensis]
MNPQQPTDEHREAMPATQMRKVDITLRALTAVEHTVTVDVPVNATDDDISSLASELFENTDGNDFVDDGVTWDEGTHTWSDHEPDQNRKP